MDEDDHIDANLDEEDELDSNKEDHVFQSHRISGVSSSSRDSTFSNNSLSSSWSVPSSSSGVESDFSEENHMSMSHEDTDEGHDSQPKPRKKPKKKSRSLLGIERFSLLFKTPGSPSSCRRAQSMGFHGDVNKDLQRNGPQLKQFRLLFRQDHRSRAPPAPLSPQKHMCIRRRPILSCNEEDVAETPTLVKVVVFGGDREAGRLARAYSDLQQKESKCPQLTRMCKLQFYFVPSKKRTESPGGKNTSTEAQTGNLTKTAVSVVRHLPPQPFMLLHPYVLVHYIFN